MMLLARIVAWLTILILTIAASGCSSWPTEFKAEEGIYVTATTLDLWQTAHFKDYRNDREVMSDSIIGHKPSARSCVLWGLTSEALHATVTDWLIQHRHEDYARLWEVGSIGLEVSLDQRSFWITDRVALGHHSP